MFALDFNNISIPVESPEQSMLTKDFPLVKRRYIQKQINNKFLFT